MLTTLKVKNGTYTNMQYVASTGDCVTYYARFKLRDGYTEMRHVTVQNDKVIAWQS
jgi:hypothetical protein